MTMDMGPGSTPAPMTGTYSWRGGYAFDVVTAAEAVDMRELTASATIRVRFVDGAYYYDVDPQPSGPLKGKEWRKVDGPAMFVAFFVMADSITTDVWVDAEGLPVRLEQNIGSMRVTMDFAKFGATAGVEAPPAAQTGDMTEELRATAQQQS
ncbi:hypothetical protein [Streptomyces mirabilis]|uniref:hypothetical protein n=1 Tax=Streptomyces mirabilis TaxID=68239 RepID=UPI0036A7C5A4